MNTGFDKIIDRRNTCAVKTDSLEKNFGRSDLLPLWVADMDFESPRCVREALQQIVDTGLYGYNVIPCDYYPVLRQWLAAEQDWTVQEEWMTFIPGIVKGIGYVVQFFTREGDGIIVQPPVYPPFVNVPAGNRRTIVFNPLIRQPETAGAPYAMDFGHLEQIAASGRCKLLILSNPHNPAGIAWDRETLVRLAALCHKYGILVVSDEIHADMPLFGHRHIPFASVSPEAARISITFGAPSKTFNMAGIVSSYAVVPDPQLREPFYRWMTVNELNGPTLMATRGAIAAYTAGNPWRREMLAYVEENVRFTEEYFRQHFGREIIPLRPQASFLVWLDCRGLSRELWKRQQTGTGIGTDAQTDTGWTPEAAQPLLTDLFINRAGLALNDGATFGPGGAGYMRLNVGTARPLLEKAFSQLEASLRQMR